MWFFSHLIALGKGVLNDEGEILKIMIAIGFSFHYLNLVIDPFQSTGIKEGKDNGYKYHRHHF